MLVVLDLKRTSKHTWAQGAHFYHLENTLPLNPPNEKILDEQYMTTSAFKVASFTHQLDPLS